MGGAVSLSVVETGGEEVGFISQSMNNPSLAYDGLTRMDVPADMHARKARYELADGYIARHGGFDTFGEIFETVIWA